VRPIFDPETLRTLATTAIDAAVHAGAEWADIRLGDRQAFALGGLRVTCGFGLRVRVRGAEAFVSGAEVTAQALVAAARSAVATAQGLALAARTAETRLSLANVPVVKGEWRAPIEIDPFSVSIDDHVAVNGSEAGVYDGDLRREWSKTWASPRSLWEWSRETRVFVSSEGSLVTQFLGGVRAYQEVVINQIISPQLQIGGFLKVPSVRPSTGGFELAMRPDRYANAQAVADEVRRYAALPMAPFEIGRRDVVLDGALHAQLLGAAVLPALSLNRALGNEIDLAGSSVLSPPETVLGQRIFSPLFNLGVDAGIPHFGAAAWDAEGVPTTAVPLITAGTVTNYLSSRSTHAVLSALLPPGRLPAVPPGVTHADLTGIPAEVPSALSMRPSATACSLTTLAKQLGNGLLARDGQVDVDPDGYGGYLYPWTLFEVRGGELVRRIYGARLMFSTKRLLPTLSAVGDASTCETGVTYAAIPGLPWTSTPVAVTAPAGIYHKLDVVPLIINVE
jgi:predicted Zn-dependent protease